MRVNAGSASLTHESIIIYLDVDRDGFIFLIGRDALPYENIFFCTDGVHFQICDIFEHGLSIRWEPKSANQCLHCRVKKQTNKKTLTLFWELALSDVIDRRSGRSTVQIYFFRHDFIELNNFIPTVLYKYFLKKINMRNKAKKSN